MLNRIELIGYVGKDAEVKTLDTGTKVAYYNLATTKEWMNKAGETQSKTEWHRVVCWRHLAGMNIRKGMMMSVIGEMVYRKYTDDNNVERQTAEVVAIQQYEITRQVRDAVPAPGVDDLPVWSGAAGRTIEQSAQVPAGSSADDDGLPF